MEGQALVNASAQASSQKIEMGWGTRLKDDNRRAIPEWGLVALGCSKNTSMFGGQWKPGRPLPCCAERPSL
jgi:hypothetical protein